MRHPGSSLRRCRSAHGAFVPREKGTTNLELSFRNRNPVAPFLSDILRVRPDQAVLFLLFKAVCNPTRHPADGESRGKQIGWKFQSVQEKRRVKFHVGLYFPPGLVFLKQPQDRPFHVPREVVEFLVGIRCIQLRRGFGQYVGREDRARDRPGGRIP
jgi:hypothetical protein